jgi:hypothetical protein
MDEATNEAFNEHAQPRASLMRKGTTVGCAMWTPIAFPARGLASAVLAEVSASGDEAPGAVGLSDNDPGPA